MECMALCFQKANYVTVVHISLCVCVCVCVCREQYGRENVILSDIVKAPRNVYNNGASPLLYTFCLVCFIPCHRPMFVACKTYV